MFRDRVMKNPRIAGQVLRYHTWPVLRQQSNGEHTWQVMRIYFQIFGPPSDKVAAKMLFHDAGELGAGDPPFPSKRNNPDLKVVHDRLEKESLLGMGLELVVNAELSDEEKRRIKICDLFEMWEYGLTELRMGNLFGTPIANDTYLAAMDMAAELPPEEFKAVRRYANHMAYLFTSEYIPTTGRI